jgi:5-methylcytosine-specific restriction protein B
VTDTAIDIAVNALVGETNFDAVAAEARRLLLRRENVILYGPPGTGKSRAAQQIADDWATKYGEEFLVQTTFHPSYSYEDFVEGFRPSESDPSKFELTPGVLLQAAKQAESGPTLLVIDEINRADVAKVFGELITYIESDKRGREFTTAQQPKSAEKRVIPTDLFVLGTMNTADKSISLLDVALRRRFKFVECPPLPSALSSSPEWKDSVFGISLASLLTTINGRLLDVGVTRDRLVGQALLGVSASGDDSELLDRIRYDVYPLVEEYLFGEAERIEKVLPGLIDAHGGLIPSALTGDNIRSWLPASANDDMDLAAEVEDAETKNAAGASASGG